MDQLFRTYTSYELLNEYYKLAKNKPELKRKNIGYKCSNAFFQYERFNTPSQGKPSVIDFWNKNKRKILNFVNKHNREIFECIQFLNHPPSQFPPNIAMWFYKKFKATKVLDPFAGWGDRCIAAMASGIDYIGVDSNKNLKEPFRDMIRFYPHSGKIKFINKPIEKVNIDNLSFDFVLTSPPFWNEKGQLLEKYNYQNQTMYTDFMNDILIPLLRKLSQRAWVCIYIPEHMSRTLWEEGLKYKKMYSYERMGNKKHQTYNIYCYRTRDSIYFN